MSEENNEMSSGQEQHEVVDYQQKYEEAMQQLAEKNKAVESLAKKKDELLAETKKAKNTSQSKDQEYGQMIEEIQKELRAERQEKRTERIHSKAYQVANELAKGDANKAELLKVFIAQELDKEFDERGSADDSVLQQIKKNFETNKKYAPLLGGSQATGGSAPGSMRSAQGNMSMKRADFDRMNPIKKAEYIAQVRRGDATLTD